MALNHCLLFSKLVTSIVVALLDYVGIRRKIIFSVSDNCVDGRASGSQSNWNTFAFWHYELFFFWVKGKLRRFLI